MEDIRITNKLAGKFRLVVVDWGMVYGLLTAGLKPYQIFRAIKFENQHFI